MATPVSKDVIEGIYKKKLGTPATPHGRQYQCLIHIEVKNLRSENSVSQINVLPSTVLSFLSYNFVCRLLEIKKIPHQLPIKQTPYKRLPIGMAVPEMLKASSRHHVFKNQGNNKIRKRSRNRQARTQKFENQELNRFTLHPTPCP
ncbi:hypothetical protein RB195_019183 [Necator americanus]|uniref:Uncharacterized protein n=1 Tax=Necator americanus TaxID=51031 RepID=A0ABR1CEZ7_NECAM